jgi:hypothetical protein
MAKSLIQTTNQTVQSVNDNSIIDLGTVRRRYGCNLRLSGNGIEVVGEGYYMIDATISVSPTTPGAVTVAIYDNGVQIPGAIAYGTTAAADDVVTLPIVTTVRQGCRCQGIDSLTAVLIEGAGDVTNISVRVEKA